jgi:hypothetical protein
MNDQERQRQMDFIVEQQARFESSIEVGRQEVAQIRRVLISAIRLARRERSDARAKFEALTDAQIRTDEKFATLADLNAQSTVKINALTDAQIRSEEQFAAFQAQAAVSQAQAAASQAQVDRALTDLSQALIQTNKRIDGS